MLIGCAAGTLNVPKIKGTHTAMKSGMVAAEAIAAALDGGKPAEVTAYADMLRASWVWPELHAVRNIRPGFAKFGLYGGLANAALDTYVFRGKAPWTLRNHSDNETLLKARDAQPIDYPKPDNKLTFDRLSSVFLSNTNHEENQPAHLVLRDPAKAISVNWNEYRSPETRYCPAGVYEITGVEAGKSAIADQRAELRALQDLRHQGPDAEYRLGGAGRGGRAELSRRDVGGREATFVTKERKTLLSGPWALSLT